MIRRLIILLLIVGCDNSTEPEITRWVCSYEVADGTGTLCDGIEGIDAEADNTGDNRWINFGWNIWEALFPDMSFTFSDDRTYTDWEDGNGTWTLDGATLTITESEGEVSTATVSGNTLTAERIESIISDADCAVMVFTK